MSNDPAIKKRLARARKLAAQDLARAGYGVIETQGEPFSIIGVRLAEARFVRVVVDGTHKDDLCACHKFRVPVNCSREIWALPNRGRAFKITSV